MNLPVYRLALSEDPESGVEYIALVDDPAIEEHFLAFVRQPPSAICFQATHSGQQIISGPLMVADRCIFRDDAIRGAHYVYFDAPTIRQIILRFFRKGRTSNVNLMHLDEARPEGIFMFESFIVDSTRGIYTPDGFEALPDGSWFGSFKVDNPVVWQHFIQTGEFRGFSVEGLFMYEQKLTKEELQVKQIMDLVKETGV